MPEVYETFPRPRSGRPVRVDITDLKQLADEKFPQVVGEFYDEKDAQSVRRQFLKMPQYRVMTAKTDEEGMRQVFVQRKAR